MGRRRGRPGSAPAPGSRSDPDPSASRSIRTSSSARDPRKCSARGYCRTRVSSQAKQLGAFRRTHKEVALAAFPYRLNPLRPFRLVDVVIEIVSATEHIVEPRRRLVVQHFNQHVGMKLIQVRAKTFEYLRFVRLDVDLHQVDSIQLVACDEIVEGNGLQRSPLTWHVRGEYVLVDCD